MMIKNESIFPSSFRIIAWADLSSFQLILLSGFCFYYLSDFINLQFIFDDLETNLSDFLEPSKTSYAKINKFSLSSC